MRGLVSAMGVSAKHNYVMNSIAVPRRPGQAIGAVTQLNNAQTGGAMTLNVEYNQLGPLLESTGDKKGDVADQNGFSLYPGNVNSLIMRCDVYSKVMKKSKGIIPEFVNPKYKEDKKTFKKPTRLESMMQEYPKLLGKSVCVCVSVQRNCDHMTNLVIVTQFSQSILLFFLSTDFGKF